MKAGLSAGLMGTTLLVALSATPAFAPPPPPPPKPLAPADLSFETALRGAQAALDACRLSGHVGAAVAVTDKDGTLRVLLAADHVRKSSLAEVQTNAAKVLATKAESAEAMPIRWNNDVIGVISVSDGAAGSSYYCTAMGRAKIEGDLRAPAK